MATDSGKKSFPGFGQTTSPEEIRRRFLEAPLDASVPEAMGTVLELASVLTRLPDVFIASQKKELDRIKAADPNDPRAQALQASIDHTEELQGTAKMGQTRIERVAKATVGGQKVFHGFVSTTDLAPLPGATVRLTEQGAGGHQAAATTDDDGYFSIALSPPPPTYGTSTTKRDLSLSQRINRLFETRTLDLGETAKTVDTAEATKDDAAKGHVRETTVQVLMNGRLLHEDPIPLKIDQGSTYREYIVTEDGSPTEGFNEFVMGKMGDSEKIGTSGASKKRSPKK